MVVNNINRRGFVSLAVAATASVGLPATAAAAEHRPVDTIQRIPSPADSIMSYLTILADVRTELMEAEVQKVVAVSSDLNSVYRKIVEQVKLLEREAPELKSETS